MPSLGRGPLRITAITMSLENIGVAHAYFLNNYKRRPDGARVASRSYDEPAPHHDYPDKWIPLYIAVTQGVPADGTLPHISTASSARGECSPDSGKEIRARLSANLCSHPFIA